MKFLRVFAIGVLLVMVGNGAWGMKKIVDFFKGIFPDSQEFVSPESEGLLSEEEDIPEDEDDEENDDQKIFTAIKKKNWKLLEALINDKKIDLGVKDDRGKTILHRFCEKNVYEGLGWSWEKYIDEILNKKSDLLNELDENGNNLLHTLASDEGGDFAGAAAFLLGKGVAINTQNSYGKTPLHIAIESQRSNVAMVFMRRKNLAFDLKDADEGTLLHSFFSYRIGTDETDPKKIKILNILIKKIPKSLNAENTYGGTALSLAIKNLFPFVYVELLFDSNQITVREEDLKLALERVWESVASIYVTFTLGCGASMDDYKKKQTVSSEASKSGKRLLPDLPSTFILNGLKTIESVSIKELDSSRMPILEKVVSIFKKDLEKIKNFNDEYNPIEKNRKKIKAMNKALKAAKEKLIGFIDTNFKNDTAKNEEKQKIEQMFKKVEKACKEHLDKIFDMFSVEVTQI